MIRILTKLSLETYSQHTKWLQSASRTKVLFIDPQILSSFRHFSPAQIDYLHTDLTSILENVLDCILDSCGHIIQSVDSVPVAQIGLDILTQVSIIATVNGQQKHSDATLALMCQLTLPQWKGAGDDGGGDITSASSSNRGATSPTASSSTSLLSTAYDIKKRHILATKRVLQLVALLADRILDWDCVVSMMEQVTVCHGKHRAALGSSSSSTTATTNTAATTLSSQLPTNGGGGGGGGGDSSSPQLATSSSSSSTPSTAAGAATEESYAADAKAIMDGLERFKKYSVYLSR